MIRTIPRDEFLAQRWRYRAGEHVTILGPTDCGKTHLAFQLLGATARPGLPAMNLVMKPRDDTVVSWGRTLGFRRHVDWPPPFNPLRRNPSGWNVWPKHTFNPAYDDWVLENVFRRSILDSYKRGQRIIFADEAAGLVNDLNLGRELKAVWMRGRSMGTGMWASSQRPVEIPLHAYSQAAHLFLAYDPDKRTRDRYDEIGGIDPKVVAGAVLKLPKWHFLYLRRDGQRIAVIEP